MQRIILLASLLALGLNYSARAQGPSHVKVVQCSPLIRQELLTIVGHPLVIAFPQGESTWLAPMSGKPDPTKKALGDNSFSVEGVKPDEIQKLPIHNLITLWPDAPGVTTMTVIAQTADGSLKTYPFTFTAIPDSPEALEIAAVTLNLICKSGPVATAIASTPQAARVVVAPRKPVISPIERAEAEERLRTQAFNNDGECHYHAKGKKPSALQPQCPMDNGVWTLVRFRGLTRKPAIYIGPCEDGNDQERLARQHESGDLVVIEEIAPQFCLRLGSNPNDVLELINDRYDPAGNAPDAGTIAPEVARDVIQAKTQRRTE